MYKKKILNEIKDIAEDYKGAIDGLAKKLLGFENDETAEKYITTYVPFEVRALAKFLNLFSKDEYIFQLKPMFCVLDEKWLDEDFSKELVIDE